MNLRFMGDGTELGPDVKMDAAWTESGARCLGDAFDRGRQFRFRHPELRAAATDGERVLRLRCDIRVEPEEDVERCPTGAAETCAGDPGRQLLRLVG